MRNLKSSSNIDYSQLEEMLKTEKWFEANALSINIILFLSNREQERWLDIDNIKFIPCADLQTIDSLWVKYSNGRYGFSIRKKDSFNFDKEQSFSYFPTFKNLWGYFLPRLIVDRTMKLVMDLGIGFIIVPPLVFIWFYYMSVLSIYFVLAFCIWKFLYWMYQLHCKRWRQIFLSRVDECNI